MKCIKKEGLRDHTRGEMHKLGQNPSREDEKSEKRVLRERERERERDFSVERDEKVRSHFVLKLFKEIVARWIEDLSSTKSRQI